MDREKRNLYMRRYHQERMTKDSEYATRVRLNAANRRKRFAEKGGSKLSRPSKTFCGSLTIGTFVHALSKKT